MTEPDCKSVRCVETLWCLIEVEKSADHRLDLRLARTPIPADGLFDGRRRVLGDLDPSLRCYEKNDSSGLPDTKRAPDVLAVEDVLDDEVMRLETTDKLRNSCVDFAKPLCLRSVFRNDDATVVKNDRLQRTSEFQDGRADHARPGVHTENPKSASSIVTHS